MFHEPLRNTARFYFICIRTPFNSAGERDKPSHCQTIRKDCGETHTCPLHAYVAKALIHDGCRCFFVFCLTIKRLLFIETKPNITSYNLYYVNLRWEKERKERHDSLYSPSTRCNRSAVKSRKLNISRGAKLSIFCNSSLLHHLSPFSVSFSFFVICSIDNTVSDWIVT